MKIPYRVPRQFGALRIGEPVDIWVKGRKKRAMYIGFGRFSNVYWTGTDVYVYTWYDDMSKDILANCKPMKHIPKIELLEIIPGPLKDEDWCMRVYKMPYYKKVRTRQFDEELDCLRNALIFSVMAHDGKHFTNGVCKRINKQICRVSQKYIPKSLHAAISEITKQAAKYDSYLFDDFAKRNWGLDHNGELVLLDALYSAQIVRDDIIMRDLENTIKTYDKQ